MPIGGINVFAFKVNTVDKGYVNVGPLMVNDWNGLSKQNFGAGEVNGDANFQVNAPNGIQDSDVVDVPFNKSSVI